MPLVPLFSSMPVPPLFSDRTSWSRRAVFQQVQTALEQAGIEDPIRHAEWLLMERLQVNRASLYVFGDQLVDNAVLRKLARDVDRRLRHEPLQYILGYTDFFGLRITVTPAVLIPRPETEQVVEAALHKLSNVAAPRVLDLGTGSGCIPLAIKHKRPDATVYACDVSAEALALAQSNADDLDLAVTFFEGDILSPTFASQAPQGLDLVISNPPYVPLAEASTLAPEVADHEPHLALFSGNDPLCFYRRITELGGRLLMPDGWLVLETHADYGKAVHDLLINHAYTNVTLQTDLAGLPRIVSGQRTT